MIDSLYEQLLPEIERDSARYSLELHTWESNVARLRKFFEEGYSQTVINNLCEDLSLSAEERSRYFPGK